MQPQDGAVAGRYELDQLIATGGMGQVWRARDRVLDREVAVKVLRTEFTSDPTFLARFRAEARHSAGLIHPNIATLFDYGEVPADRSASGDDLAYLVMELVRGESLSALLRREGPLSPDRTLDVLRQAAAGLAAAHAAGVIHRDVKPGNLLLTEDGAVKITDFGVASSAASASLTLTGQVVGTAHYLSPEQVQGQKAGPASDVYALGLVGYECLAGHRAFEGESSVQVALMRIRELPRPLPATVPAEVRRLIEVATATDPAARFADGAALRDAVDALLAGEPATARQPTVPPPHAATAPVPPTPLPRPPVPVPPVANPGTAPMPATRVLPLPAAGAPAADTPAEEPAGRRRRRVLIPLLALLLLAGIGIGGIQLFGDASETATTRPLATTPPAPSTSVSPSPSVRLVSLTAGDFVGHPLSEVQSALTALGFTVTPKSLQTSDVPDGQVIALDPTGPLARGTAITVTYAVAPPPPPTPTPTVAPETTAEPTDDNGNDDGGDQSWTDDNGDDSTPTSDDDGKKDRKGRDKGNG